MVSSSYMPLSGSILEDLAALQDQSTESLTEALYACHQAHRVYTHCGAVIVALNPFENVPNLCVQRQFHDTAPPKQRPHVYAVGENAYNALLSGDRRNQTIVITGESGSGKTISCNHIIDYLAARGQAETGLSAKLINAGAVLEAFGNAPTARNHNSSRYAKVVNIHFGPNGGAMGASVSTFLLERGRVTDENPFHIITALREIDSTGESERFDAVCEALLNVGIDVDAQERLWEILRGIDCLMRADDVGASEHFGIDAFKLREAIRNRTVKVGADVFNKQREGAELQAARHGLVRSLYVWMFEWLVEKINVALGAPSDDYPSVSLVDIFGFESFDERNSLAQFLINWANEQLLCHLSEDMLEHEADQYAAEGIAVDRPPKLPSCLPLLVGTPGSRGKAPQPGISSLLDDETRRLGLGMKNVTDEGFARNVAIECNHHHGYVRALAAHEFKVAHYAATVAYDSRGFLAANSERVDVKLLEALAKTDNFVRDLVLSKLPSQSSPRRDPFTSVVTSFRQSIQKLDALLASTRVHYVHCIKPNEQAKPRVFEHDRVQMQMEATGVAHISRFARAHGPLKIPREDMPVYALLLGAGFADADLSCVVAKLNEFAGDPDGRGVQLGSKHIFFRSTAMERIQDALEPKLAGLRQFQSAARAYIARSSFRATRSSVVRVQALARGRAARAEFQVRLAEARAAAKAAAEKAAAERAAAERAAAEKAAAEKAAAEKAAAEKSATRLAAENVSNRTKTPDAKLTPKPETRALDVVDANRPAELTPDTTASDRTTPVVVPVTPKGEFSLSHSDSFLLDNFEHPSVNVDTVDIVDGGLDTTRSSFDLSSSDHASSVLGSILDDYDETSSSMQTSAGQHDPPPEMLRDLAGSPFTDSSSTSILISSLLAGASDCDSAARVGIVLGSVVRWYDAAKLRYVPEVLANEFLRSALPAVRRQRDVPQLWCIAIMAHAFRVQLSSTHVLVKQLERLQETALDLVLQGVYSVAEETISAALAPDSARKMSAGRPLLDTLWGEMSQFSDVVRDVTGRTILDRMFQHLIARILTKKIREQNATHVLASLGWVFEWRDEVGLAPSRIENIAMLMLHFLAGFDVDGDDAEVEDFTVSMEKLLSRTHSSQPTKAANAALRAIADEAPVDLSAELGHALSLVEVFESAGDAANHLGEHIISKKPVYTFLAWVGRVAAG